MVSRATVRSWFDQQAGLAGWISVLVAIAVAFAVILADRLSTQRDRNAAVNAEINQISQAASEFDPIIQQYIKLVRAHDPQANGYYVKQLGDPRLSRINVFIKVPVDPWPSVESHDAFRRYYDASFRLLETSADGSPSINTEDRINAFRCTLEALQKTLDAARR
jgi:hypothetical protein